jgi:hypothetical protein
MRIGWSPVGFAEGNLVSKAANVEMDHGPHWAHECLDMTPR